ncbi:MAG TPA: hypothetical protein VF168_06120 [Trueperaceae bacterium]
MRRRSWAGLLVAAFLMLGAAAQAQLTISVAEHPEYGTYLTDGQGMTLYLFVQDAAALATPGASEERFTEGVREQAAECTGGCLDNWPPLLAEGGEFTISAEAEGQLDPELLYVADVDGRSQIVYNGWPLYYFARDTQAGDVNGQGVGNRWFVISPEGQAELEVAGGGEAAPAEEGAGGGAAEEGAGAPAGEEAPMDDDAGEAPMDEGAEEAPADDGAGAPADEQDGAGAGDAGDAAGGGAGDAGGANDY